MPKLKFCTPILIEKQVKILNISIFEIHGKLDDKVKKSKRSLYLFDGLGRC